MWNLLLLLLLREDRCRGADSDSFMRESLLRLLILLLLLLLILILL
jgi:hypothetical protein